MNVAEETVTSSSGMNPIFGFETILKLKLKSFTNLNIFTIVPIQVDCWTKGIRELIIINKAPNVFILTELMHLFYNN